MSARVSDIPNLPDINLGSDNPALDKLTYDIFSILENNFLFGSDHPASKINNKLLPGGKVRILSIDAGGSTDGLLAAKSLAHLESILRQKSGDPNARIADFFDVVAGAGSGGILASLLFTRGKDGAPMFTAVEALKFIVGNRLKFSQQSGAGIFRRFFPPVKAGKTFKKLFKELTLKDTLKAVLIPCYDLSTGAPFLFSRADALEMDGCDFKMADVCGVSVTNNAVELKSANGKRKIAAVGNGIAMSNPTAAAVTHVLNNKQEFPFCKGVEDVIVVSLGNGEMDCAVGNLISTPMCFVGIAGDGAADMVDQAVSMAFGHSGTDKYVRIQGNGIVKGKDYARRVTTKSEKGNVGTMAMMEMAEEMLSQKNVESVLFKGKKLGGSTNMEKLELFAGELIKEQERRKNSVLPPVVTLKQAASPRSSSATSTLSTLSSC